MRLFSNKHYINSFFNKQKTRTYQEHIKYYNTARTDLLIIILFTVLNIVLLLFKSQTIMIFSACAPYIAVIMGFMLNEGTDDIYIESGVEIGITIAIFILAVYFVCWLKSKNNYKWLSFAAFLFIVDTIITIMIYYGNIIDIAVHCIALYFLTLGVISGRALKNMSEETVTANVDAEYGNDEYTVHQTKISSEPLRYADDDRIQSRHLCTAEYMGLNIIYRRVKRTNELVVNGYVYDEIKMLFETEHELQCIVNGYKITAGYTEFPSKSYIKVNDEIIKSKVRIL